MNDTLATTESTGKIIPFIVLVFLAAIPVWLFAALTAPLIPEGMPINHLGFLAVFVPAIVAFILTCRKSGLKSAKELLGRSLDRGRIPRKIWYLVAVYSVPVLYVSALVLLILMGAPIPESALPLVAAPILFLLLFVFAAGEEIGWQGYLFDSLEKRWNASTASVALGLLCSAWHFPLFLIQNPPGGLLWIAVQSMYIIASRVLIAWVYNNTGKSVFAATVFHNMSNACTYILPIYDVALGPVIITSLFIIAAVAVTYFWGSETLSQFRFKKEENVKVTIHGKNYYGI
ncbi:MAG: type II CAAX prenyl endopeptidase Rce1 family protein [Candidatus Odinarchaeota archaeon]